MGSTKVAISSRFRWLIDPSSARSQLPWDVELDGNRSFAVVPSLGSLVPGWLLAVPRRPLMNLSMLGAEEVSDLDTLVMQMKAKLAPFGTEVFCFEHGARHAGSPTGCGADQAHLHIVPLEFDLLAEIRAVDDTGVRWVSGSSSSSLWHQLPRTSEYIAVRHLNSGDTLIGYVHRPMSQWVRRVIARALKSSTAWDYRAFPNLRNIEATIRELRQ